MDLSPEMLAEAPNAHPRLRFDQADLREWRPLHSLDLLVSNAALHWVPDHPALLERLVSFLGPGGRLAVQVPMNHDAPSHQAVRAVAERPEWSERFAGVGQVHVLEPGAYLDRLRALGSSVDLWTTTYHHLLAAPDGPLEWLQGTTLRPYLARLDPDERTRFLAAVSDRLQAAYPPSGDVVPFPFRRLFFVAEVPP